MEPVYRSSIRLRDIIRPQRATLALTHSHRDLGGTDRTKSRTSLAGAAFLAYRHLAWLRFASASPTTA